MKRSIVVAGLFGLAGVVAAVSASYTPTPVRVVGSPAWALASASADVASTPATAITVAPVVITARYIPRTPRRVAAPRDGSCNFASRALTQGVGAVRGFCGGL